MLRRASPALASSDGARLWLPFPFAVAPFATSAPLLRFSFCQSGKGSQVAPQAFVHELLSTGPQGKANNKMNEAGHHMHNKIPMWETYKLVPSSRCSRPTRGFQSFLQRAHTFQDEDQNY